MNMETRNTQELSLPETPERVMLKWTTPKVVTISSEKSESGAYAGLEGSHTAFSTNLGS